MKTGLILLLFKTSTECGDNAELLDLSFTSAVHLADCIEKMKNHQLCNDETNCIRKMKIIESNNVNLIEKISISHCDITEIPENFNIFRNLKELCALNNNISSLPDSFESLTGLKTLDLLQNKINVFPKVVGKLSSLEIINISSNLVSIIPVTLINLANLKEFYASNNRFSVFPEAICKINSLEYLTLSKNSIETIPRSLNLLENIKFIDLSKNQISEVEDCFSKLRNLERIDLSNNKIRSLPASFRMLNCNSKYNLKFVDLRNNPLDQWGEGDSLGVSELLKRYEDVVIVDSSPQPCAKIQASNKFRWNLEVLRTLKIEYFNFKATTKNSKVATIDELYSDFHLDYSTYISIKNWISETSNFKNINHLTDLKMNLIGSILGGLKERSKLGDVDWLPFSISYIVNSIENEPVGRQIADLKLISLILVKMPVKDSRLDILVECLVSVEKEAIFDLIFAPDYQTECLCNLKYWKNKLKREIGLCIDGCDVENLYDEEFKSKEEVIDVFFRKFTVNFVVNRVSKLMESLNVLASDLAMRMCNEEDFSTTLTAEGGAKYEFGSRKRLIESILLENKMIISDEKNDDSLMKSGSSKKKSWWRIFYWK